MLQCSSHPISPPCSRYLTGFLVTRYIFSKPHNKFQVNRTSDQKKPEVDEVQPSNDWRITIEGSLDLNPSPHETENHRTLRCLLLPDRLLIPSRRNRQLSRVPPNVHHRSNGKTAGITWRESVLFCLVALEDGFRTSVRIVCVPPP